VGTAKIQGEIWGARPADWVEFSEPAWRETFVAALNAAGIGHGIRHLDVGCGAGGMLVLARDLGAEVAGIDASEALVEVARRRLPGVRIDVGEMEELPFDDESFDVVTGINSLQFAENLVAALAEARRVCRRGGSVLMLVWGPREQCELLTVTMPAVFGLLPPARPGAPPPLPLSEPGYIEGRMAEAGLDVSASGDIASALVFPNAASAVRAILSASARAIAHSGEGPVEKAVAATLGPVTRPDGRVIFNNRFRWVRAARN
jgi:SAM-dependent methyltransferase